MSRVISASSVYRQEGFTLFELMVVLVIAFVLFAIAFPSFSAVRNELRVREDTQNVALIFGELRAESIRLKRDIAVNFQTTGLRWDIDNDGTYEGMYTLNAGSTWTVVPTNFIFNGFGLARGIGATKTVTLDNHGHHNSVTININGHVNVT